MPRWPTPDYYHCLDKQYRQQVYEPEADSFLFLEGLEKDGDRILASSVGNSLRVVEIGCGSGIVISFLATILSFDSRHSFQVVDINPTALEVAVQTFQKTLSAVALGSNSLLTHKGDLFSPFVGAAEAFDIILFNPPYVPTSAQELQEAIHGTDLITAAWCGGERGREVVDRFIAQLPQHLSNRGGVCYIIAIKENDVEEMIEFITSHFTDEEVSVEVVVARFTGESLSLLRVVRNG